ncbi:GntR family transcriptional regulator [Chelativorans sp. AA-79]|uniref:GntR family transcriptional regulator n=1 Tax=Chelativorans sp. AA-79 TaxID=3028735 RepID=UPI0023F8C53F|nr:GntR family transcriptional regulator [Chelativorans sp. AA-79]WEX08377.1 GntR family transcriptional regulator [Chelativorans sp. AA-79]
MLDRPAGKRQVQSDIVAEQLEEEIITGRVSGGSRLDESSIAVRFGVSRTPVREALHALCARSLAERIPYKGVVVAQISTERIGQMFEAMAEMEAVCGRIASQRMSMIERAELESLHRLMNELAEKGDHEAYERANTEFHDLIFRGSHNEDLVALAAALRLKLAPFRKYQLRDTGRLKRSCSEHQQIVDALLDQDPKAAETALRRHLISAAQEVLVRREAEAKHD